MHRIKTDFHYDKTATTVTSTVADVIEKRAGVCQDFAHLALACLRSHGLAARYVSGYLATRPPAGKPRLVGADASHAWVAAWIPGSDQWLAFDPTNDQWVADRHVTVAWGRDYGDVPPVKGVIFTEAKKSTLQCRRGRGTPRRVTQGCLLLRRSMPTWAGEVVSMPCVQQPPLLRELDLRRVRRRPRLLARGGCDRARRARWTLCRRIRTDLARLPQSQSLGVHVARAARRRPVLQLLAHPHAPP